MFVDLRWQEHEEKEVRRKLRELKAIRFVVEKSEKNVFNVRTKLGHKKKNRLDLFSILPISLLFSLAYRRHSLKLKLKVIFKNLGGRKRVDTFNSLLLCLNKFSFFSVQVTPSLLRPHACTTIELPLLIHDNFFSHVAKTLA